MAKWLDKYEQGGMVLKKKTKDNYGKKPNVNDVKVSAGPGFEGDGYTAQNWKSPAWGGQFAMGGALPGAVGFTYARTAGSAPANGKYTKKTLASAQKGKNILKDYKFPDDILYTTSNDNIPSTSSVNRKIAEKVAYDTDPQRKVEAAQRARDRQGYITKAGPEQSTASKVWNVLSHPMTALSYKTRGKDIPEHFERGEQNILENATNILNPFFYANEGKEAIQDINKYNQDVRDRGFYRANPNTLASGAFHAFNALPLAAEAAPFISKAAKYIPTSSRYISELENLGHVQTAGPDRRALQMMMGREPGPSNVLGREAQAVGSEAQTLGTQARSQRLAAYEPPTDAELALMNEAEANRYFRRPAQQTTPDPDSFDWTPNPPRRGGGISQDEIESYLAQDSQSASAAQAAQNDIRSQATTSPNANNVIHRNNPTMTEDRLLRRQNALRTSGFTDAEIAADETAIRAGEALRTPSQIRGGGQGTFDLSRNRPETPMKEWNPKEFRIGEGDEEGILKMEHPEGHVIKQDIRRGLGVDAGTSRSYEISDKAKGSNYIKVETSQDAGDPFTDVNDISFFNRDPASSSKQMNIVFSHLPTKARIAPINTSIHSQPLLDTRMAKLSSGQPGRIQIKPEYMGALNKITREQAGRPLDWYNEILQQFPKLQRTTNTLNEYTSAGLQEPFIKYRGRPIPFEEFNSPEMKRLFENPQTYYDALNETDIMVNKYKTIKNWKNGGHFIDSMGQWAHPGDITTIPSNDITMRGVDYDVMGISNTGDKKLMKPGKNYKFDGDYVTEYPRGGWLEKYK